MKLHKKDFGIYGLCPARDEFYLVVCEICGVLVKPQALQQHAASRHLHCDKESSCAKTKFSGGNDGTAMHGSYVIDADSLSCETLVLKHCDEMNSTDKVSANESDCINVSSPLICCHSSTSSLVPSSQNSLIDTTAESLANSGKFNVSAVSQNDQLRVSELSTLHVSTLPCDRLCDIRLSEENTANSARNNVSVSVTETRTGALLGDCSVVDMSSKLVSCKKESSIARDLRSLQIDGVSALSSVTGVKNREYFCHSGQLPEINRIHIEAGNMLEVNSSDSFLKEHYTPLCVDPSAISEFCLPECVLPNVTMARDSQNGLSAVGHFVSCFKSMTAMAKSQKSAHHERYNSNGHVGVLLPAFQKQYTRSLLCKSRSRLLRHAGHNRFKPLDVLHEQRERRRIICHKKLMSLASCTPAVRQQHCLSSNMQPSDPLARSPLNVPTVNGCEPSCSYVVSIPLNSSSSDILMDTIPSCHPTLGYNTHKNVGADKLERKTNIIENFDKHLKSRKESTADTLKEQTADGGHVTYDRSREVTTSVSSFSGKPDAQVVMSGNESNEDELSTPLLLATPPLITRELLTDMTSITYHPNPLSVNGFTSWLHGEGSYICNRASDVCRSSFSAAVEWRADPLSFNNTRSESPVSHGQDIWKSSQEKNNFCLSAVSESSGLFVPCDSSAYGTTGSLSECFEDRCASSADNVCLSCSEVQANVNSTSVCLSSVKSMKHNQHKNLPVALMAATQSSVVVSTLTLQSPREPYDDHLACDTRISEMHTAASSSAITKITGGNKNFCINMNVKESPPLATACVGN